MEGLLATPRVLEIGFDLLSAAAGLFVVAMALRAASAFTLSRTGKPCGSWPPLPR
ncbi:MAG: hypothetical protein K0S10_1504 [Rubrobacteraceae bacterium]|jgi:hypothetical protein|nr:hypothetical protein [Rubrobacteraceae bacterium]